MGTGRTPSPGLYIIKSTSYGWEWLQIRLGSFDNRVPSKISRLFWPIPDDLFPLVSVYEFTAVLHNVCYIMYAAGHCWNSDLQWVITPLAAALQPLSDGVPPPFNQTNCLPPAKVQVRASQAADCRLNVEHAFLKSGISSHLTCQLSWRTQDFARMEKAPPIF